MLIFNRCGEPRILGFEFEFELAPSSRESSLQFIDLPQLAGVEIKFIMDKIVNSIRGGMLRVGDASADQYSG